MSSYKRKSTLPFNTLWARKWPRVFTICVRWFAKSSVIRLLFVFFCQTPCHASLSMLICSAWHTSHVQLSSLCFISSVCSMSDRQCHDHEMPIWFKTLDDICDRKFSQIAKDSVALSVLARVITIMARAELLIAHDIRHATKWIAYDSLNVCLPRSEISWHAYARHEN